jgi:ribosomal protein S21
MSKGKHNFSVKLNPKLAEKKSTAENNEILIKKFTRKWKKSGILKELKEKSYPITRGMKRRRKKHLGKRRSIKR